MRPFMRNSKIITVLRKSIKTTKMVSKRLPKYFAFIKNVSLEVQPKGVDDHPLL